MRGHHSDERRVAWTQNTIDNEKLGRKSSKICCIYHKPKNFDESSSDSSSSSDSNDTGDEHDDPKSRDLKRKIQERKLAKQQRDENMPLNDDNHGACQHDHEHDHSHASSSTEYQGSTSGASTSHNAYEKGVR